MSNSKNQVNNQVVFSGTQKFCQTVNFGENTIALLTKKYNLYIAKMETLNQAKMDAGKDVMTIKSFNDFASAMIAKFSNAIALTLNLKESDSEYSLQGLKLTGKNIGNIVKMAEDIENAITTGFILRDNKKIFIFGFSYSTDDKTYYRFNQFSEFSAMLKTDGITIKSIYNSGLFNSNIK